MYKLSFRALADGLIAMPQMFIDCPHRACNIEQMQDNITELLNLREPFPPGFISKVKHLAKAASEANSDFLETKMLMTTSVTNILSTISREQPVDESSSTVDENEENETTEEVQDIKQTDSEVNHPPYT